jgi:CheY-like chemotaxis protein
MRTPLNAIIGLSSLELDEKESPDGQWETLQLRLDSGHRLRTVINDILDSNKLEVGKLEILPAEYDLPELLNDITPFYTIGMMDNPVRFVLEIDENLPLNLFGDEPRIKQICHKLLSNAFKFTSQGVITLSISWELKDKDAWLSISVKDTGIGIRPEDISMLFSDYGQIDAAAARKVGGTGLGLGIAKRLAELMGGTLTVSSEYGKGSVFTLCLRQKIMSNEMIGKELAENFREFHFFNNKREQNQRIVRARLPNTRVLIVDDLEVNLKIAEGIMMPYGMQIDCVSSGKEAVELIRQANVTYNIIFMDYMMPEMDGIEATRIIRKEIGTRYAKTVPIIALTAAVEKEALFMNNGFNAFLGKPIDIAALDREINRWVRGLDPA